MSYLKIKQYVQLGYENEGRGEPEYAKMAIGKLLRCGKVVVVVIKHSYLFTKVEYKYMPNAEETGRFRS